jgi:2OG-Fe(II) oxygenase superfamily
MKAFEIYDAEHSIVAHRDGDYYGTHIDTRTQAESAQPSIRVISCVYYLYWTPRKFSGGELLIHRLGAAPEKGSSSAIEPVHDRLVAFPSFLPHEVLILVFRSTAGCTGRGSGGTSEPVQDAQKLSGAGRGRVSDEALAALRSGVRLKDGLTLPAEAERIADPQIWPRDPPIATPSCAIPGGP